MDVRGREVRSALHPASRVLIVLGIFGHYMTLFVNADDHLRDEDKSKENKDEEEDRELCEKHCDYGCCANLQCCQPSSNLPQFSVQVIAVVGACVVTLMLLCLCVVRYRMTAKITRHNATAGNAEAGRSSSSVASAGCHSVCSQVPGPHSRVCSWNPLRSLMMLQDSHLSTSPPSLTPTGIIVTPPPYSECDPRASASDQLPPPYEEVVKPSDECVTTQTSPL